MHLIGYKRFGYSISHLKSVTLALKTFIAGLNWIIKPDDWLRIRKGTWIQNCWSDENTHFKTPPLALGNYNAQIFSIFDT